MLICLQIFVTVWKKSINSNDFMSGMNSTTAFFMLERICRITRAFFYYCRPLMKQRVGNTANNALSFRVLRCMLWIQYCACKVL